MSRYLSFAIVICACIGIAYGAAVKIKSFTTYAPESGDADGMAILNYATGQDKTVVQVILSDFSPNLTYTVAIDSDATVDEAGGTVYVPDGLLEFSAHNVQADSKGHITLHATVAGADISGSDVLVILQDDWDAITQLPATFPLRAVGLNPGQ